MARLAQKFLFIVRADESCLVSNILLINLIGNNNILLEPPVLILARRILFLNKKKKTTTKRTAPHVQAIEEQDPITWFQSTLLSRAI